MRSQPFYGPDGMSMAGHTQERAGADLSVSSHDPVLQQLLGVTLPHERHDDGLVHAHNWAISTNSAATGRDSNAYFCSRFAGQDGMQAASQQRLAETAATSFASTAHNDAYDDGLVHNHHWATTKL